ncbi:MAG: transposase [Roseivivax sp.]|nr:transposase [Roseivivax sp.]
MVDEIGLLRQCVRKVMQSRPFVIDAWVVLPDHMHAVWTLPEDDANYSDRWGAIKARFSKHVRLKHGVEAVGCKPTLPVEVLEPFVDEAPRRVGLQPTTPQNDIAWLRSTRSLSKLAKQDAGIWQRRFWEHHIRGKADFEAHLRYCWGNPVKHGYVERAADWPYSSFHRDARLGRADPEFVGEAAKGRYGEVA